MICLLCNSEEFDIKEDAVIPQYYKGRHLMVHSPGMICKKCGYITVGNNQIDSLLKETRILFNKKE